MTLQETSTEQELLTRLSKGDPSALREIIESYFPVLCKFAEKYLPDSSLAKDVVQEAFIKFWGAKTSFDSLKALKGYLYSSTRNGCLNLNRGRDRQENRIQNAYGGVPDSIDSVSIDVIHAENISLIYQVVRTLPEKMQTIFRLSYEDGLTVSQISARLNMKPKAVKNYKYRTLMLLRGKFGNNRGALLVALSLLVK